MVANELRDSPVGRVEPTIQGAFAFIPAPLPRQVALDPELVFVLDAASRAVSMLAGIGETLVNPHLLISPFLRREAVLSSRIEGTHASISDVYAYEAGGRTEAPDAQEVTNYVRALERGRELLVELPICVRLVLELHAVLLQGVRGQSQRPGELRDVQVWIGSSGSPIEDARFVPPPHLEVPVLLSDWERFLHDDASMPPLVRCALMHYQFEAIHPFTDGNGRLGRLLIPLFLIEQGVLRTPLLYLSAYFEQHRDEYYRQLFAVSVTGDWKPWLQFFLKGVEEQSADAIQRSRSLRELHESYRRRLQDGRVSTNALRLLDLLFQRPVISTGRAAASLEVTDAGARGILRRLEERGIVSAVPGSYPQLFVAEELLDLLR